MINCLKLVLAHEGGWTDNPHDPGGATMKGVTLKTYREHFGYKTKQDLQAITEVELRSIYRQGYWNPCRCDDLPPGVNYCVFDAAVHSGPKRASRWLQLCVGAVRDGIIGPKTLAKVRQHDPVDIVRMYANLRLDFLKNLKTWHIFGNGWSRRIREMKDSAMGMVT